MMTFEQLKAKLAQPRAEQFSWNSSQHPRGGNEHNKGEFSKRRMSGARPGHPQAEKKHGDSGGGASSDRQVQVVFAKPDAIQNRKAAIEKVIGQFAGGLKKITMAADGQDYQISKARLEKMTAHLGEHGEDKSFQAERIIAIQSLNELAREAVAVPDTKDKKDNPMVEGIRRFYAPFSINGEMYIVRLLAKRFIPQVKQSNTMHSMAIEDVVIKKIPTGHKVLGGVDGHVENGLGCDEFRTGMHPSPSVPSSVSLRELLSSVNHKPEQFTAEIIGNFDDQDEDGFARHDTHWITVGAVDHKGGTPVEVNDKGKIEKGPKALKGKTLGELKLGRSAEKRPPERLPRGAQHVIGADKSPGELAQEKILANPKVAAMVKPPSDIRTPAIDALLAKMKAKEAAASSRLGAHSPSRPADEVVPATPPSKTQGSIAAEEEQIAKPPKISSIADPEAALQHDGPIEKHPLYDIAKKDIIQPPEPEPMPPVQPVQQAAPEAAPPAVAQAKNEALGQQPVQAPQKQPAAAPTTSVQQPPASVEASSAPSDQATTSTEVPRLNPQQFLKDGWDDIEVGLGAHDSAEGAAKVVEGKTDKQYGVMQLKGGKWVAISKPGATNETQATQSAPATNEAPVEAPGSQVPQTSENATPRAKRTRGATAPKGFSRAAIQQTLMNHHQQDQQGLEEHTDQEMEEIGSGSSDASRTFLGKLPGEVERYLEGNPNARKFFKVTDDPEKAQGEDAMAGMGEEKYFDTVARRTGTKKAGVDDALEFARNSPDPQIRLLAAVHDTIPADGPRPAQEVKTGDELQPGQAATINGIPVEVHEDEDGNRMLVDHGDIPETPLEPTTRVPIDKGSMRDTTPEVPVGDFAPLDPNDKPVHASSDEAQSQPSPADLSVEAPGQDSPYPTHNPPASRESTSAAAAMNEQNGRGRAEMLLREKGFPLHAINAMAPGTRSLDNDPEGTISGLSSKAKQAYDKLVKAEPSEGEGYPRFNFNPEDDFKRRIQRELMNAGVLTLDADEAGHVFVRPTRNAYEHADKLNLTPVEKLQQKMDDVREEKETPSIRELKQKMSPEQPADAPQREPSTSPPVVTDAPQQEPTGVRKDLFGRSIVESSGIGEQRPMFHEPVKIDQPASERVGSANANDPTHTGTMFPTKSESGQRAGLINEPAATEHPVDTAPNFTKRPQDSKLQMGPLTGRLERVKQLRESGMSFDQAKDHYEREQAEGRELQPAPEHVTKQAYIDTDPAYRDAVKNYEKVRDSVSRAKIGGQTPPEKAKYLAEAADRVNRIRDDLENRHNEANLQPEQIEQQREYRNVPAEAQQTGNETPKSPIDLASNPYNGSPFRTKISYNGEPYPVDFNDRPIRPSIEAAANKEQERRRQTWEAAAKSHNEGKGPHPSEAMKGLEAELRSEREAEENKRPPNKLMPGLETPFNDGWDEGSTRTNKYSNSDRMQEAAFALGAYAKQNNLNGEVRKMKGNTWAIGDTVVHIEDGHVTPATIEEAGEPESEAVGAIRQKVADNKISELKEMKHSKTGEKRHVVVLNQRVERDKYLEMAAKAKALGGWYSSYKGEGAIPGFHFKDKASAEKFRQAIAGTKTEDVAEKTPVGEASIPESEPSITSQAEKPNPALAGDSSKPIGVHDLPDDWKGSLVKTRVAAKTLGIPFDGMSQEEMANAVQKKLDQSHIDQHRASGFPEFKSGDRVDVEHPNGHWESGTHQGMTYGEAGEPFMRHDVKLDNGRQIQGAHPNSVRAVPKEGESGEALKHDDDPDFQDLKRAKKALANTSLVGDKLSQAQDDFRNAKRKLATKLSQKDYVDQLDSLLNPGDDSYIGAKNARDEHQRFVSEALTNNKPVSPEALEAHKNKGKKYAEAYDKASEIPTDKTTAPAMPDSHEAATDSTTDNSNRPNPETPIEALKDRVAENELSDAQDREAMRDKLGIKSPEDTSPKSISATSKMADRIADHLVDPNSGPMNFRELYEHAKAAGMGSLAEGTTEAKHLYDAMELGVNRHILNDQSIDPTAPLEQAQETARKLDQMLSKVPTQTWRSKEQQQYQQFSTPPQYAFAASWLANMKPTDTVLEPSAGTGSLAVYGMKSGAHVVANELSSWRAGLLKELGVKDIHQENAEQIGKILHGKVNPDVVIMNPPFSQTAGRMGDKKSPMVAANHIAEALNLLPENGRLVAIVGQGMSENSPTYRHWFDKMKSQYNLRANVGVDGDVYKKYGTHFGTRVLVFDKNGPTQNSIGGDVDNVVDLMSKLEGVRNDRPDSAGTDSGKRAADQSSLQADSATSGSVPRPDVSIHPSVGDVGTGAARGTTGPELPTESTARRPERIEQAGADNASVLPGPGRSGRIGVDSEGQGTTGSSPIGSGVARDAGALGNSPEELTQTPEPNESADEAAETPVHPDTPKKLSDDIYDEYKTQHPLKFPAQKHPTKLAESAAMGAVLPPKPSYQPKLDERIIREGIVSDAQLEPIIYAGQAHSEFLPGTDKDGNQVRRGWMSGDGTGVGKGRIAAGIIQDNLNQGRKKAIWVSKNFGLHPDAVRDYTALGGDAKSLVKHSKWKPGQAIDAPDGVLFTAYGTLGSDWQDPVKSRVKQIVDWAGKDFDGAIVFDESHMMKNSLMVKGKRGMQKPSAAALAAVELQKALPKARITYLSATGATEVSNLGYAQRLGLWGQGTEFTDATDFANSISAGGISGMELVAQSMKQQGAYLARQLSYQGVHQDKLAHKLTPDQRETYNKLAEGWQSVLRNIEKALEITAGSAKGDGTIKVDGKARGKAVGAFWGANQRFFNQVITSMQMPSVLADIEKTLKHGTLNSDTGKYEPSSVVLQLVNTNEASQDRELANVDDVDDIEDLDLTPRDQLLQMVQHSFPTTQHEPYVDENGNTLMRPVLDSKGDAVHNPQAVAMREKLLSELASIKVPEGPLESLLNHFGHESVAEVTGRSRRVVRTKKNGIEKNEIQSWGPSKSLSDAGAFQDGKKRILVFSGAGGTGKSYHSDKGAKNQQRRVHYLLQAGWVADAAVQGFGRTHRSGEVNQPVYKLVHTDLNGQKRFISTIARRLDQLGALTRGQRQAATQGMFSELDNLESPYAADAMKRLITDMSANKVPGMSLEEFQKQTGLKVMKEDRQGMKLETPPISQFLNRLLSMNVDTQNKVFDQFMERFESAIDVAKASGQFDSGMETVRADSARKTKEKVVYTDPKTGAETKHVTLELKHKITPRQFKEMAGRADVKFMKNKQSGRVYAFQPAGNRTDTTSGRVEEIYRRHGPVGATSVMTKGEADYSDKYEELSHRDAEPAWDDQIAKAPTHETEEMHLLTGSILPIWKKVGGQPQVRRVQTDDGEKMLGRIIPEDELQSTMKNLNVYSEQPKLSSREAYDRVTNGDRLILADNWKVKPVRVAGEQRLELIGPDYRHWNQLEDAGAVIDQQGFAKRVFIPTGPRGADVLGKVMNMKPIERIAKGNADFSTENMTFAALQDKLKPAPTMTLRELQRRLKFARNRHVPILL